MAETKKKAEKKQKTPKSKISNVEWGMVIGALAIIDAFQAVFDLIGIPFVAHIGMIINPFIDMAVGFAWPTYLYLRGVNLKSVKTVGSIALTFFCEAIPDVDALPLWFLDGLFVLSTVKAEEIIEKETGIDVEKAAALAEPEAETQSPETEKVGGGSKNNNEGGSDSENGPGSSDEYADAMGQESDNRNEGGTEDDMLEEDKEGGEDHQTSDEDADELGKESDNKSKEGETPEEKEKKDKGKKNTPAQGGGMNVGGRQGKAAGTNQSPNQLNLRNPTDEKESKTMESPAILDNILDLSLSYGARKKKWEEEQQEEEDGQNRRVA